MVSLSTFRVLFNLIQSQTCIIYGPDQGEIYGQCQRKIKEEIEGKGSFLYFFNNLIGKVKCPTTKLNEKEKTFHMTPLILPIPLIWA